MLIANFLQKFKLFLGFQVSEHVDEITKSHKTETLSAEKKDYKYSGTHLDLEDFNGILYNAGFSFQVEYFNLKTKEMLIKGSFDLSYYTQLHFTFSKVEFTTLEENDIWNDAWYGDQITILPIGKRDEAKEKYKFSLENQALVFKIHSLGDNEKYERIVVAESMQYNFYLPNDNSNQ